MPPHGGKPGKKCWQEKCGRQHPPRDVAAYVLSEEHGHEATIGTREQDRHREQQERDDGMQRDRNVMLHVSRNFHSTEVGEKNQDRDRNYT